ncbi:MAG: hypothetical protein ACSHWU_13140 [Marinicella sp.]
MSDMIFLFNSYIHTIVGSLALIGGLIALSVQKGAKNHRLAGRVFVIGMAISSITSLVFMIHSFLPLAILMSVTTLILLFSALLTIKRTTSSKQAPQIILTVLLLLLSFFPLMLIIRSISVGNYEVFLGPLLMFLMFMFLVVEDWKYIKNPQPSRQLLIKRHLTRMILAFAFGVMALVRIGIKLGLSLELSVILPLLAAGILIAFFRKKIK